MTVSSSKTGWNFDLFIDSHLRSLLQVICWSPGHYQCLQTQNQSPFTSWTSPECSEPTWKPLDALETLRRYSFIHSVKTEVRKPPSKPWHLCCKIDSEGLQGEEHGISFPGECSFNQGGLNLLGSEG